mmetsp:Transcript_27322/g.46165  ORF Transcript_27322/g.46165 Transcript_27322/m.46165 type:complete len:80 (-) Transcript_27322:426-665(-)
MNTAECAILSVAGCDPSQGVDAVSFADSSRPSTWANQMVPFVYIHSAGREQFTQAASSTPPSSRYHVGKWLWFVDSSHG